MKKIAVLILIKQLTFKIINNKNNRIQKILFNKQIIYNSNSKNKNKHSKIITKIRMVKFMKLLKRNITMIK